MTAPHDEQATPVTASCGYCLGSGKLYRVPSVPSGAAPTCTSCSSSAEGWEAFPCPRCEGTGLLQP